MCALFTKMTALECKWLVRIILKKLGLNLNHTKILNEYHPDAARYLKSCSWLSRVCEAIESGRTITEFTNSLIKLFQPIRPMLCQKAFIKNIDQMLANDEYYLETKMDGERYQIHIDGREFRYFSRNTNDFTKKFGSDSSGGNFTPTLARLLSGKLSNAILDGKYRYHDWYLCSRTLTEANYELNAISFLISKNRWNDGLESCRRHFPHKM